jgi:IS5 family transposase
MGFTRCETLIFSATRSTAAERLIRRVKPPERLLGDKAYDSAELREELDERGDQASHS